MKINRVIFCFLFLLVIVNFSFGMQADNATRRFGIFIGSNNGGRDRVTLRYAVTDAQSMKNVFNEMGGIAVMDSVLLVEPTIREINRRIDAIHEQVLNARGTNRRTEIIFYYSGHSDEEGLLLNREKYMYRELRERINRIPSDMRIVILDSCASGAFTRIKGGERTLPFLVDSSFTAEGYAFLTSSSANEASQESDRIGASYFTHSLVAGLRGAADSVGDGRVTLNELYRYAYAETLARTETSLFGAQHPSYDIQISGTGDLVLTDVSQTSAGIVFDERLTGRISIRNSRDHLIVELTKTARPLELGLEPGSYRIILQQGNDLSRADVTLIEGRHIHVTRDNFSRIDAEPTRRRGDDDEEPSSSNMHLYTFFFNVVYEPFPFPLIGFVNNAIGNHHIFQCGFVNNNTLDFNGFQAGFVNTIGNDLFGFQAGFVNTIGGDVNGFQAGFVNNNAGDLRGFQSGFFNNNAGNTIGMQYGFVNITAKKLTGLQFGFVNITDSVEKGVPIGFISIVKNGGYKALEFSFSEFFTYNAALKTGIEKFYTSILVSYKQTSRFSREHFAFGFGFGSILPINKLFYFNPELTGQTSVLALEKETFVNHKGSFTGYKSSFINYNSFIPYFGFNFGSFSIAAAPSVTWIHSAKAEDMPDPLFRIYMNDINDNNRIVVGGRIAARVKF
ncbi:MAG: caspase family protein [Treponema sp.]|nr:caspase family protein [Treponema sp.]